MPVKIRYQLSHSYTTPVLSKVTDYMQKNMPDPLLGIANMDSDNLPTKIGKNADNNRYQLSPINNSPIIMKFAEYM